MKKIFSFVMMALVLCTMTLTSCNSKSNNEPSQNLVGSTWQTVDLLTTITVTFPNAGEIKVATSGYLVANASGTYTQDGIKVIAVFNTIDDRLAYYLPKNTPITCTLNGAYTQLTVKTIEGILVFDKK